MSLYLHFNLNSAQVAKIVHRFIAYHWILPFRLYVVSSPSLWGATVYVYRSLRVKGHKI